ncbi:uncharacterized protein LOC120084010 [Benincasa hispida]|uniref:uncharacterized protein LOC120084010 n=1 Tax=Benincasa hispida TaxID=102211 RepID=UPI0018FFC953|nr:uncharacterized protein LOC120084010 [Benincasa hispida]
MPRQAGQHVKPTGNLATPLIYASSFTTKNSTIPDKFNNSRKTHTRAESTQLPPTRNQEQNNSTLLSHYGIASLETVADTNLYIGSGASTHVTSNPTFLHSPTTYTCTDKVIVDNGTPLNISQYGSSTLLTNSGVLSLFNILYVPEIVKILVSVSKLAKDNNILVEFHVDFCVVKDKESGVALLKGKLKDGLYQLDIVSSLINNALTRSRLPGASLTTQSSLSSSLPVFTTNITISKLLLHRRLGHPSSKILVKLISGCI